MTSTDPGLCGILPVDKPAGITSHDVVAAVRRRAGQRRVGHAGTLDPMATGLLLVLLGPATRLATYVQAGVKGYVADIRFGTATDTDDADGQVQSTLPVPDATLDEDQARACLSGVVGAIQQRPPAYSAIKVSGRKAYDLARAGNAPELASRPVEVYEATLEEITQGPPPEWRATFSVSKGTYVRALARDIGLEMGTVAHLAGLRRVQSGRVSIDTAHTLPEIERSEDLASLFLPLADVLELPRIDIDETEAQDVAHGRGLRSRGLDPGTAVAVVHDERMLAVYEQDESTLRASVVMSGGCR